MNTPPNIGTVLVVDDEPVVSNFAAAVLTRAGWDVTAVSSGNEALALLAARPFDVVVTDIAMPDIEGTEVIAAVRKLQPATRIVAISGGGRVMSSLMALNMAGDLGAAVRLSKPFTREQLCEAVAGIRAPTPADGFPDIDPKDS